MDDISQQHKIHSLYFKSCLLQLNALLSTKQIREAYPKGLTIEIVTYDGKNYEMNVKENEGWTPFTKGHVPESLKEFDEVWINNIYQVLVRRCSADDGDPYIWLSIKTHDRSAVHDWRDLQRIKNELCGTQCEGMEIYPSADRLVDTSNQFHLWVLPPGDRISFGYSERLVISSPEELKAMMDSCGRDVGKAKQRFYAEHHLDEGLPEVGPVWEVLDIK